MRLSKTRITSSHLTPYTPRKYQQTEDRGSLTRTRRSQFQMSHNPTLSFSFLSDHDPYYAKTNYAKAAYPQQSYQPVYQKGSSMSQSMAPQGYQLPQHFAVPPPFAGSDVDDAEVPQTDFDPFYSDIAPLDSELDPAYLGISEPFPSRSRQPAMMLESEPANFMPAMNASKFATDLPSDPPFVSEPGPYDPAGNQFDELPSSPPSSPEKPAARQRPQEALPSLQLPFETLPSRGAPQYDPLGISHSFHRPRPSIISAANLQHQLPPTTQPGVRSDFRSPTMDPPTLNYPVSPYLQKNRQIPASAPDYDLPGLLPPKFPSSTVVPNLSPTLSDASLSPDVASPEHVSEFSWQPILTLPRSDQSEAIIEQQRKPKLKRRSRLPDGVVDEYVGTTEEEHVYVCLYPNCHRLFKRTYNLRSHIQTHLCDRPYTCALCNANFVRPHDLRRHERCHSLAKPFVCPCGKGFNRQDAMQRHRLRDICAGGISTGAPKSPKPRGRPKGRRNTPNASPELSTPAAQSPAQFEGLPAKLGQSPQLDPQCTPHLNPPRKSPQLGATSIDTSLAVPQ